MTLWDDVVPLSRSQNRSCPVVKWYCFHDVRMQSCVVPLKPNCWTGGVGHKCGCFTPTNTTARHSTAVEPARPSVPVAPSAVTHSVGVVAARQCHGLLPMSLQRADRGPAEVARPTRDQYLHGVLLRCRCVVVFETAADESQPSKTHCAPCHTLEVSLVWEA
jgi:hypothetical protein